MLQQTGHLSIEASKLPQTWPDWDIKPIKKRYKSLVGRKNAKERVIIIDNLFKLAQMSIIFPRAIQLGLIKTAPKIN